MTLAHLMTSKQLVDALLTIAGGEDARRFTAEERYGVIYEAAKRLRAVTEGAPLTAEPA